MSVSPGVITARRRTRKKRTVRFARNFRLISRGNSLDQRRGDASRISWTGKYYPEWYLSAPISDVYPLLLRVAPASKCQLIGTHGEKNFRLKKKIRKCYYRLFYISEGRGATLDVGINRYNEQERKKRKCKTKIANNDISIRDQVCKRLIG